MRNKVPDFKIEGIELCLLVRAIGNLRMGRGGQMNVKNNGGMALNFRKRKTLRNNTRMFQCHMIGLEFHVETDEIETRASE
jgi:hypothetical protein